MALQHHMWSNRYCCGSTSSSQASMQVSLVTHEPSESHAAMKLLLLRVARRRKCIHARAKAFAGIRFRLHSWAVADGKVLMRASGTKVIVLSSRAQSTIAQSCCSCCVKHSDRATPWQNLPACKCTSLYYFEVHEFTGRKVVNIGVPIVSQCLSLGRLVPVSAPVAVL